MLSKLEIFLLVTSLILSGKSFGKENSFYPVVRVTADSPVQYDNLDSYFKWKVSRSSSFKSNSSETYTYYIGDDINVFPSEVGLNTDLVATSNKMFLNKTPYIDPFHPEIEKMADKIRQTGESRKDIIIQLILDSVNNNLSFDTKMIETKAVVLSTGQILDKKEGVCQHYSNIFVALSRNLNIPSRMIIGYKMSEGQMVAHVWVEVLWNDDSWIPLEPQNPILEPLNGAFYFPLSVNWVYEMKNEDEGIAKISESGGKFFWKLEFNFN